MKRVIFLLVAPLIAAALYATLFSDLLPDKRSVALSSVDRGDGLKSLRSSTDRSAQPDVATDAEEKASGRIVIAGIAGANRSVSGLKNTDYTGSRFASRPASARQEVAGRFADAREGAKLRQAVEWLGEELLQSENPLVRERAILKLAEIGGKDAYLAISGALTDPDVKVRELVIQLLGEAGQEQLHVLGQVLFAESNPELRRQGVEIIAALQSPAALALLQVALQDEDEEISLLAESRLIERGWMDERYTSSDLAGSNDGLFNSEATIAAIHQVYLQDPDQAVAFLSDLVAMDQDPYVREEAIIALAGIGGEDAQLAMASALGDEDVPVRELAIQLLAKSDGEILPLLGQVLFGEPDAELRRQAVTYIAQRQGPAASALLEAAVADTDKAVSLKVHRSLRRKM